MFNKTLFVFNYIWLLFLKFSILIGPLNNNENYMFLNLVPLKIIADNVYMKIYLNLLLHMKTYSLGAKYFRGNSLLTVFVNFPVGSVLLFRTYLFNFKTYSKVSLLLYFLHMKLYIVYFVLYK